MSETLSFIPMDRRQALVNGQNLPKRTVGAALFADISGFTPMTEALAHTYGPRQGAEELTRYLHLVFTALISEVHAYRGSVIGFSGDAITCWFDGDTGLRASTAALAMQRAMRHLAASLETATNLSVKVAVASGQVRRFVVGQPAIRLIDVVAGHILDTLAVAERLAQPGEVVFAGKGLEEQLELTEMRSVGTSGELIALVASLKQGLEPDPWPTLPKGSVSESQVRPWLHGPVFDRFAQGGAQFLGGFRPAAALFLSFRGIDYERDEQADTKLNDYVSWVQTTVNRYEGAVIQLTIGDKGSYLYAAFGAPLIHNDDAARAVAAAQELQQRPDSLDFITEQRIGVAYGQMYTGAYGSATRRTYGVLSRKTNLAARLMSRAGPGGIVCDDATYRRARERWAFEALTPVQVKGTDKAVAIYSPTGRLTEVKAGVQPLVGRDREVEQLQVALRRLQNGTGQVIFIEGEAGIGKTRILDELRLLAARERVEILVGAGPAIEQETPYRAWRDIFEGFFKIQGLSGVSAQFARVRETMQDLIPTYLGDLPLMEDVLNLALSDTDQVAAFDAATRKTRLFDLLSALLKSQFKRPVVLVLEDAQWLDSLSWAFAQYLAQTLIAEIPCLLVIASRPVDKVDEVDDTAKLRGLPTTVHIDLKPLSPEVIRALVAHDLDVSPTALPPETAALVQVRAGGNPFVAKELTRALLEQKIIRVEAQDGVNRVITSNNEVGTLLPDTLQGLILSRFDALPSEQQALLKVAAVIGRSFSSLALRDTVAHLDVLEAFRPFYLRELTRRDFIRPDSKAQALSYLFNHIITHDVVYETLLFSQRRRVHQAVAAWFEASYHDRLQDYVTVLAHHYSHAAHGAEDAALVVKAVHFLEQSTDQSALLGAYKEAVRAGERILEVLPNTKSWSAKRAETLVRLGGLAEKQSLYAKATNYLAQGLRLAREADTIATEIDALCKLCLVLTRQGNYGEAQTMGERALERAQGQDTASAGVALAHSSMGIIAAQSGDFAAARTHFESSATLCRELGDLHQAAYVLNNLGLVSIYENDSEGAFSALNEAYADAKTLSNRELMARVQLNLGFAAERADDYRRAEQQYRESLALFREIGGQQEAVTLTLNLGDVAAAKHEPDKAWELFYEAFTEAQTLGALPTALLALRGLAALLAERGEVERAAELLGLALHHPASNAEIAQNAEAVLKTLKAHLTPESLENALRRGEAMDLAAIENVLG